MSGRKRTKRKNSEEDFDVDEGDDGLDIDEINRWACHSCTFVNRAAAFRCCVCGTRKGTSTRRSRCDDNVVEMQKSITTMVQKQVEKEKSLKRKERSIVKSSTTGETSEGTTTSEVKGEVLDQSGEKLDSPTLEDAFLLANTLEIVGLLPKAKPLESTSSEPQEPAPELPKASSLEPEREKRKYNKKKMPKLSRESTPSVNGRSRETTVTPKPTQIKVSDSPAKMTAPQMMIAPKPERFQEEEPISKPTFTSKEVPLSQPSQSNTSGSNIESTPSASSSFQPTSSTTVSEPQPTSVPLTEIPKDFFIKNLPESIVKQLNLPANFDLLSTQKLFSGINPVVSEQKQEMRDMTSSLGSNQTVSPTTSRQSSETDSSSSEGNRSFDTPHTESSTTGTKCCQIPDYMIHRDTPQKFVIIANGLPVYFEEFPRRIH